MIDLDQKKAELKSRKKEEINSIKLIYNDVFTQLKKSEDDEEKCENEFFEIFLKSDINNELETVSLKLEIELKEDYPLGESKFRIVDSSNISKTRIDVINEKIVNLLERYPQQEILFIVITEIKNLLDEFQTNKKKMISLEEEREQRMLKEIDKLKKKEEMKKKKKDKLNEKQNTENKLRFFELKKEYMNLDLKKIERVEEEVETKKFEKSEERIFFFDAPLFDFIPQTNDKFSFNGILGFIRYEKEDLMGFLGTQYLVRPVLSLKADEKVKNGTSDILYLFTEVMLNNLHWMSDMGKKEIHELELELQRITNIQHTNILRLLGFQIDRIKEELSGWIIYLLTEFSFKYESLNTVLLFSNYIDWTIARKWLIQILPAIEYLHNNGIIHKLINPLTVYCCDKISLFTYEIKTKSEHNHLTSLKAKKCNNATNISDFYSKKILKFLHPSYGFKIFKMLKTYPNFFRKLENYKIDLLKQMILPNKWVAPELRNVGFLYKQKTDIWCLGVLFIRIMLGYNIIYTTYRTPDQFFQKFLSNYSFKSKNAALVYDLLLKMLNPKISKRASSLELNAVKFLRDGPTVSNQNSDPSIKVNKINTLSSNKINNFQRSMRKSYSNSNESFKVLISNSSYYGSENSNTNVFSSNLNILKNQFDNSNSLDRILGRYERDFEELEKLGNGSYGQVFKSRNRMEGKFYAIKKIKHKISDLDSLLSEVLLLARLNHQYIVRYYSAWVEDILNNQENDSEFDNDQNIEIKKNIGSTTIKENNEKSQSTEYFLDSLNHQSFYSEVLHNDLSNSETIIANNYLKKKSLFSNKTSNKTLSINNKDNNLVEKYEQKSYLYIQMEFCENNTLHNLIQSGLATKSKEYWRIFRQILEAVSYIHSEGLIHRDLKPKNIFMDKSNNVKIGDFGLAKKSAIFSKLKKNNNEVSNFEDLSTVIGTYFYIANEVSTGDYNEKIDIYSLGIIFFEMCYSFSTGMERDKVLKNLRLEKIVFPNDFKDPKFFVEKKLIKLLLNHNPKLRPDADYLLESGLLPDYPNNQLIKKTLNTLSDPASPWQKQVRDALFKQDFTISKDFLIYSCSSISKFFLNDPNFLLFNQLIKNLNQIFSNHGAIQNFNLDTIIPKISSFKNEIDYEVLDKNGFLMILSHDLTLPIARYLSRTFLPFSKVFYHEFVYRKKSKTLEFPEKINSFHFDIVSHNASTRLDNDAECLKVVDEILDLFSCFKIKNLNYMLVINHHDIIDSIVSFSFGNMDIGEKTKHKIIELLSQLDLNGNLDEIKKRLREELNIPYTVIKELIDEFNFTTKFENVRNKLQRIMIDSPYFYRIEKVLDYFDQLFVLLNNYNLKISIYFNPLISSNHKFYKYGIMFQVIFKLDPTKNFSKIITGGRYDSLISEYSNNVEIKRLTPYSIGFSINLLLIYVFMLQLLNGKFKTVEKGLTRWYGKLYDVLVTGYDYEDIHDYGYSLINNLWMNNISSSIFFPNSEENIIQRAINDGANWIVFIKQTKLLQNKYKNIKNKNFNPLKVKNISQNKDTELNYKNLLDFFLNEINENSTNKDQYCCSISRKIQEEKNLGNGFSNSNNILNNESTVFTIDIDQKVTILNGETLKGRKNKNEKWELMNNAKLVSFDTIKSISKSSIFTTDLKDEVLDFISTNSIHQTDDWFKKIFSLSINLTKSHIINLHTNLNKEFLKGSKWLILHSSKTQKCVIVNLKK